MRWLDIWSIHTVCLRPWKWVVDTGSVCMDPLCDLYDCPALVQPSWNNTSASDPRCTLNGLLSNLCKSYIFRCLATVLVVKRKLLKMWKWNVSSFFYKLKRVSAGMLQKDENANRNNSKVWNYRQSINQSINIRLLRHDEMQDNNSKQKGNTVSKKKSRSGK